jgi:hypothetical protein
MAGPFPEGTLRQRSPHNHRQASDVCDARDGVKDGMIFDVSGCNFKPADLRCPAAKVEAVSERTSGCYQTGFAGPKDSRGNQFIRILFDTGITATGAAYAGIAGYRNSRSDRSAAVQQVLMLKPQVNSNPTAIMATPDMDQPTHQRMVG